MIRSGDSDCTDQGGKVTEDSKCHGKENKRIREIHEVWKAERNSVLKRDAAACFYMFDADAERGEGEEGMCENSSIERGGTEERRHPWRSDAVWDEGKDGESASMKMYHQRSSSLTSTLSEAAASSSTGKLELISNEDIPT